MGKNSTMVSGEISGKATSDHVALSDVGNYWDKLLNAIRGKNIDKLSELMPSEIWKLSELYLWLQNRDFLKDSEQISQNIHSLKFASDKMKKFALNEDNKYLYYMGYFVAESNWMIKEMEKKNQHLGFTANMQRIFGRKYVKELMLYLFEKGTTQNKILCQNLQITASQLNRILNPLKDIGSIEEFCSKKFKYYSLTKEGSSFTREYLLDTITAETFPLTYLPSYKENTASLSLDERDNVQYKGIISFKKPIVDYSVIKNTGTEKQIAIDKNKIHYRELRQARFRQLGHTA